jgi:site-specific recombinase XerD
MKPYMTKILGSDALGATTLTFLAAAWAPSTVATYGSTIRRYFDFCTEQQLAPLAATPVHMARYVAWLGQLGTIKASSLQHYLSTVNRFFKDHGLEAIALGDLVAKVRKGKGKQPHKSRLTTCRYGSTCPPLLS